MLQHLGKTHIVSVNSSVERVVIYMMQQTYFGNRCVCCHIFKQRFVVFSTRFKTKFLYALPFFFRQHRIAFTREVNISLSLVGNRQRFLRSEHLYITFLYMPAATPLFYRHSGGASFFEDFLLRHDLFFDSAVMSADNGVNAAASVGFFLQLVVFHKLTVFAFCDLCHAYTPFLNHFKFRQTFHLLGAILCV